MQISPHVGAEFHLHCAVAGERVWPVELFSADRQFDAACAFVSDASLVCTGGDALAPPAHPGLGLEIDWQGVAGATRWSATVA
jgi:hypothetical protein